MKRILISLGIIGTVFVLSASACSGDNDQIRARDGDVYRYTHWKQTSLKGRDTAELHFINETENKPMVWKGDVRDAMVYLEQIDKGLCYRHPVTRDEAEKVPCG